MHYFIAHKLHVSNILRIICRESEIVVSAFGQLSPHDDYNYLGYSKYLLFHFRISIFTILKSFKNEQNGSTTVEEGRNFPPYFKQVSIFKNKSDHPYTGCVFLNVTYKRKGEIFDLF